MSTEAAYRKALFLLERRDYTVTELCRKLKEKCRDISEDGLADVIRRLSEYGFLDDRRFARQYISYYMQEYSQKKLSMKLRQKGISRELFDSVYAELCEDSDENPEREALQRAVAGALRKAERKGYEKASLPPEEVNRMMAALFRKGFSVGLIRAELTHIFQDNN